MPFFNLYDDIQITQLGAFTDEFVASHSRGLMDFTEAADPQHRMLKRALRDDCWDVLMVGFNLRPAPLSAA